jgi:hypothetical protein
MKSIYAVLLAVLLLATGQVKSQILYSEPFSSSLNTCTASAGVGGNWIWTNACAQGNTGAHTIPGAATFSGSSCQFGNGSSTVSGDLSTPTIAIGTSGGSLSVKYYINNECVVFASTCTFDVLRVQISTNGGATYTDLASNATGGSLVNTAAWVTFTANLNPYSNQTIKLRFNFNSIDGVGNNFDGIYVDDITVTGNCFVSLVTLPGSGTVTPVICAGNSVTLTTNAVSNFSWSNGATTQSIVVSPTVNTNYSISATSSANCVSSGTMAIIVNPGLPVLNVANTASANTGTCPNSTAVLTGSGANTYTWSGGSVPVTNGAAFQPTSTANYTLNASNACGTVSTALSISIHPLPTVTGVASQPTICSGNPVTLTGLGSAISFTWNGNVANGSNIFPSVTANHTVIGTSALGCTASAVVPVTVVTTPAAPITANPPLICIGSSATLSSSGATSYTWTTPSGPQSGSVIVVSPLANTAYTLTKSNANCINIQTNTLYVNLLPSVFAIVSPTLICASTTATLNAGGAQTYTWTSNSIPAYTVTGANPIVSPSITTLYTVAASDGTCANTTTVLLTTNPNPTVTIAATSTNICQGDNVSLTAGGALGYTWTTLGIASNPSLTTISESPIAATLYQVTGINGFNCTSNQQQVVLVRTTPTISIGTTKPLVCKGAPSTLTASSQGGNCTYTWDANAGSVTNSIATVNPLVSTSYTVIGLAVNGCTAQQSYPVSVFLPTFAVNTPTSSCKGGTITLTANGANTYTWNGNQPFSSIQVSPPTATAYVVAATSNSSGVNCVSTNTVIVSIYNNPTVTAVSSRTQICKAETTTVTGSGATTYTWNTNQVGTAVPINPSGNTTYTVTGTDQNGCTGTATVLVKVSTCFGIDELSLTSRLGLNVYPNPNNGVFKVSAKEDASIRIENELGQVVAIFELNEENHHVFEVSQLAGGVYFINIQQGSERSSEKIVVTR